jgi:hypothetical protein
LNASGSDGHNDELRTMVGEEITRMIQDQVGNCSMGFLYPGFEFCSFSEPWKPNTII